MDYEEDIKEAAKHAERGMGRAIRSLAKGLVMREDDLTGVLKGNLDAELEGTIGTLIWACTIVNHGSGKAALEKEFGADLLFHVTFNTPELKYNKGVLIQSKRLEPYSVMLPMEHDRLVKQCEDMLRHTPAAFVFTYSQNGMRAASATLIAGSQSRDLND